MEYASATRIIDRRRGAVTEYLVEVRCVCCCALRHESLIGSTRCFRSGMTASRPPGRSRITFRRKSCRSSWTAQRRPSPSGSATPENPPKLWSLRACKPHRLVGFCAACCAVACDVKHAARSSSGAIACAGRSVRPRKRPHLTRAARPVAMPYAAESIVVTAAREAKKIWPFLTGMAVVGAAVVKVTAAATPEVRRAPLPAGRAMFRAWPAMRPCAAPARWRWARSVEFRFLRARSWRPR